MGSFQGHALPGSFFFLFSSWWAWSIYQRYFKSRQLPNAYAYRSTATFSSSCCPTVPLEGILKIVAVAIGITGEAVTGFEDGHFTHLNNGQHITMFFFFGLSGLTDILLFYKFPVPPDLDYVTPLLSYGVEGLLFLHHLHGRTEMDIQVHMFLIYTIGGCMASVVLEIRYRDHVLPALARTYFTMVQGTWFWQIGFILYNPFGVKWDESNHMQMMVVTMIFTWHLAAVFVLLLVTGGIMHIRVRNLLKVVPYQKMALSNGLLDHSDNHSRETNKLIESDENEV